MKASRGDECGRFTDELASWREKLAGGTPWHDVEADILACCRGRTDTLAQLLLEAEVAHRAA